MPSNPCEDDILDFGDSDSDLEVEAFGEDWMLDDESDAADDEVVTPTAAEIQSLLSQLAEPSVVEPTAAEPAVVEPAVVDSSRHDHAPASLPHVASPGRDTLAIADLDDELREAFLDDAGGCVGSMESSLLRLESDPADSDAIIQICRELHTLKGASASVGLTALADQLHELENTLTEDKESDRAPNVGALLASVDSIRDQIAVPQCEVSSESITTGLEAQHVPAPATFVSEVDGDESVRVKATQLNRLMDMLAQLVMLRNRRANELSELQEIYHELIGSVSKMRTISNEFDSAQAFGSSLQISEVANDVLEIAQQVRSCSRPISQGNEAVSQFIREFREELVELRRAPIAGLFQRLQRVVRDAAKADGKDVRLELIGADTGIERSLQQRLYEPLLHIVRNSVCHGIEQPAKRKQSGKNECGTISLTATSGPDLLVIDIRDDGGGLDYEAIRRRGIESGLLDRNQTATKSELAQLIFKAGFSTRQSTDQLAGRGVGMDVVASTLQRMRGWLEVDSEAGRGTHIRISCPLPSVIQHAMVFRAANQLFALPMQSIQATGGTKSVGTTIALSELLGKRDRDASSPEQRITLAGTNQVGRVAERITLLVDEIVGPEELVLRPMPALLKGHPYCSGATLSGMGSTVLFLDSRRLLETCSDLISANDWLTTSDSSDQAGAPIATVPRVLVVDDSISARKRVVRSLQRYPVEIVEANDGKQALEALKHATFAAVFSDMEMPHVSGMELLADVNANKDSHTPPVVIISSRSEIEFTGRAKELGANNYLIKPLTDQALDQALVGIPSLQSFAPQQQVDSSTLETTNER